MSGINLLALGRLRPRFAATLAAIAGVVAVSAVSAATDLAGPAADMKVVSLLKARLPNTKVTKMDCAKVEGLCEVTAGQNLFYIDHSARYLVIGRVYDMQTRQDLTATRLLEMNPDMLVGGAAKANASAQDDAPPPVSPKPGAGVRTVTKTVLQRLPLETLPKDGAIVWGNPAGKTVTIFTDFHCGYCKALSATLRTLNVRVVERPISVLGSRDIANQVYCARNREEALHRAYEGMPLSGPGTCNTTGLDANERFARRYGLTGTPVIVRADGAMIEGYRPAQQLAAWLAGGHA
jgi:thiol:disulfide interchange protein DsbC